MASRSGTEGPDLKVGLTSLLDSETRPATYDGPADSSGFITAVKWVQRLGWSSLWGLSGLFWDYKWWIGPLVPDI